MKAINAFPYTPDVEYKAVDVRDTAKIIPLLQEFSKNRKYFIETHIITADALRKHLNSKEQVTYEIRNTFLENLKEIDQHISKILLTGDHISRDLVDEVIEAKAYKRYYQIFDGTTIDDLRLNFLKLLQIYEAFRFHNSMFLESWTGLKNIFGEIEIYTGNHTFLQQVLSYKIYPRLNLVGLINLLIRRMSFILRIQKEKISETSCRAVGKYSPQIQYNFSSIFDQEITKIITQLNDIDENKTQINKEKKTIKNWKEAIGSCLIDDFTVDCRCDAVFNQGYSQVMKINSYRLQIEEIKIKKSIYIETEVGLEEKYLRREIVRSLISKVPVKEKIRRYDSFLNDYFTVQMASIALHFSSLNHNEHTLLMYHFSPSYFFRMIIHHMRESRNGFIHRFINKDNMVRELPFEYVKISIGHWWDKSIYQKTPFVDKNSKEKYDNIMNLVIKLWEKEQPEILKKINADIEIRRAFKLHNLNIINSFIQDELPYLFYLLYTRFMGNDFIYHQPIQNQNSSEKQRPTRTIQFAASSMK